MMPTKAALACARRCADEVGSNARCNHSESPANKRQIAVTADIVNQPCDDTSPRQAQPMSPEIAIRMTVVLAATGTSLKADRR